MLPAKPINERENVKRQDLCMFFFFGKKGSSYFIREDQKTSFVLSGCFLVCFRLRFTPFHLLCEYSSSSLLCPHKNPQFQELCNEHKSCFDKLNTKGTKDKNNAFVINTFN
ncbi:hypothetical protein ACFFRR_003185 [Megaselia abdita]